MAVRKSRKPIRPIRKKIKERETSSSILNFFRFGESYSSLLLGIIVVIITTILLVLLVRDRNVNQSSNSEKNISSTNTELANSNITPTTATESENEVNPTNIPTVVLTTKPIATATKAPTITLTPIPTNTKVQPTQIVPTKTTGALTKTLYTHTVTNGESLWSIAEKYYRSGYNWIDISSANTLPNPGELNIGMKLVIPDVKAREVTVVAENTSESSFGPKITGTTYKIQKGDHLWGVAIRAFNDGYKWVEIAKINNITSPDVIQPGLVLKLPRTASATPAN